MLKTINFYVSPYLVNNNLISLTEFFDLRQRWQSTAPVRSHLSFYVCTGLVWAYVYNKPTKMYKVYTRDAAHIAHPCFSMQSCWFVCIINGMRNGKTFSQLPSDTPSKSVKRRVYHTARIHIFQCLIFSLNYANVCLDGYDYVYMYTYYMQKKKSVTRRWSFEKKGTVGAQFSVCFSYK